MQAHDVKLASLQSQLDTVANRSLVAEVAADVLQGQLQEQRVQVMDLVMLTKAMQVCNLCIVIAVTFMACWCMLVLSCSVRSR